MNVGAMLKQLWGWSKASKHIFYSKYIVDIIAAVLPIAYAQTLRLVVDHVTTKQYSKALIFTMFCAIVGISQSIAVYKQNQLLGKCETEYEKGLKLLYHSKLQSVSLDTLHNWSHGEILSRYNADISELTLFFSQQAPQILSTLIAFVTACIYICNLHPVFVISCVLPSLISLIVVSQTSKKLQDLQKKESETTANLLGFTQDCIYGLIDIKANCIENNIQEKMNIATEQQAESKYAVQKLMSYIRTFSMGMHNLTGTLIIGIGSILAILGQVSVADVIAVHSLFYVLCNPIRNISTYISRFYKAIVHFSRVKEILDLPDERTGNPLRFYDTSCAFRLVNLKYIMSESLVLQTDVIAIPANDITYIMGKSGSGKSTLSKLFIGYDNRFIGEIKLFGMNIKEVDPAELRRTVIYISKDVYLHSGSLNDNCPCEAPERLEEMLKIVELDHLFDMGARSKIDSNAQDLSGGERQRLILALALCSEGKVFILDEIFSGVDIERSRRIISRIKQQLWDRTFIVITHSSELTEPQKVIFISDGKIKRIS